MSAEKVGPASPDALWDQAIKDRTAGVTDRALSESEVTTDASLNADGSAKVPKDGEIPGLDMKRGAPVADEEDPEAKKKAAADPLADLSEGTRKIIQDLRDADARRETELKGVKDNLSKAHGTIGNLKQQVEKQGQRVEPVITRVEATEVAAKAAAKEARLKKRADLRSKLGELPDILAYLDEFAPLSDDDEAETKATVDAAAKKAADEKAAADKVEADELAKQRQQATGNPTEVEVRAEQRVLTVLHPNWTTERATPEFKDWWTNHAPAEVKKLATAWKAEDTAKIFDAFKKHKDATVDADELDAERTARLARGDGVQGRGGQRKDAAAGGDDAIWNQARRDRDKAKAATG